MTGRRRLAAGLVTAMVVFSGCSSSESQPREDAPPTGPNEVDVGFARDMATHHAQAVDMADRIRARTVDPELRAFATDIVLTQQAQIGRMQGWLDVWGEPLTTTAPPMSWAGSGPDSVERDSANTADEAMPGMPGMAMSADIAALDDLVPAEAERRFLELMIEHHRGGVQMAEAAVVLDPSEVVGGFAQSIVDGQKAEIVNMERMLEQRAAPSTGT